MLAFLKQLFTKPAPVRLLDGTPGTFLKSMRKYSEMEYTRLFIIKAKKPWADVPCVMCDEIGGEYTIHGGVIDTDEDGNPYEMELCWAVHRKHFDSTVGEEGNAEELQQHGAKGRKARR
jgi:hypothetical protein